MSKPTNKRSKSENEKTSSKPTRRRPNYPRAAYCHHCTGRISQHMKFCNLRCKARFLAGAGITPLPVETSV